MTAKSMASDRADTPWSDFQIQVANVDQRRSPQRVLGVMAESGAAYRWGIAAATGRDVNVLEQTLSRIAVDDLSWAPEPKTAGSRSRTAPARLSLALLHEAAECFAEGSHSFAREASTGLSEVNERLHAVLWAAAMPHLALLLPESLWWDVLERLQWLAVTNQQPDRTDGDIATAARWLHAVEMGMTLAWRLAPVPTCVQLADSACQTLMDNLDGTEETVEELTASARSNRLMLASILRCERLVALFAKKRFRKAQRNTAWELAVWTAAMTRHDGTAYLSPATAEQTSDDSKPLELGLDQHRSTKRRRTKGGSAQGDTTSKRLTGLFTAACHYEEESLRPAFEAALGARQTGGRLAWEVSLPDTLWQGENSGQIAMMPQWDVRRGRTYLDYRGDSVQIDLWAGRRAAIQGVWETVVEIDGQTLRPTSDWENSCDYTDDDVHYVELQQSLQNGVALQRQIMVVRDDRCVLLTDAVVNVKPGKGKRRPNVRCFSRLPIAAPMSVVAEEETREVFLSDGKRRAMVVPLAAGEWRVGRSQSQLRTVENPDHLPRANGSPAKSGLASSQAIPFPTATSHLVLETTGHGNVYSPLWFDFQTRRFRRKRTWRALTVGEDLRTIPRETASAFRLQIGSEHWTLYRSFDGNRPRTFLGKNLIADFFAARFHPGDGGMEELVTVDTDSEDASD
ncbi:MAG: hypothetical protein AAGD07_04915 [Planctomycetota bacterium]